MKKLTFIDVLMTKSRIIFGIVTFMLVSEFIRHLLTMYQSDNALYKFIVWFFTPYLKMHIFWGIITVMAPLTVIFFVEYFYRKLAGE